MRAMWSGRSLRCDLRLARTMLQHTADLRDVCLVTREYLLYGRSVFSFVLLSYLLQVRDARNVAGPRGLFHNATMGG